MLVATAGISSVQALPRFYPASPVFSVDGEGQPAVSNPSKDPLELIIRSGKLQIRWNEAYPSGDVFLYDLLGNKIFIARANEAIEWNMENLRTGVYFVVWKDGRNAFTKKFLYRQD
jgi:hypothetical protein